MENKAREAAAKSGAAAQGGDGRADAPAEPLPSGEAARTDRRRTSCDRAHLPPLMRDRAFWGMNVTQFFGAFNDNLFKQLMLLLALRVTAVDLQGAATVVFALPFLLFSGVAGFLSDRFPKRPIIVLAKVAEIAVMLLGMAAFAAYGVTSFTGLLLVLFLMGTQSAFFGPGKYGILPEMLRPRDLPRANGFMLMTTFFAIIFGIAAAGMLKDLLIDPQQPVGEVIHRLWIGSGVCVGIAVVGTASSLLIRRVPAANPRLAPSWGMFTVPGEMRRLLAADPKLLAALGASCAFWGAGGVATQVVNSFGEKQLVAGSTWTSILTAIIAVGIAVGAVVAGMLCRRKIDFRIVRMGAWGMVATLLLLALPGPHHGHLLGYGGSAVALVLLGAFAGMYAIPVQVFLQVRPPEGLKGRMIATMNQANFAAILLAGVVYFGFDRIVVALDWPRAAMFALTALLMLPWAWLYRPANVPLDDPPA